MSPTKTRHVGPRRAITFAPMSAIFPLLLAALLTVGCSDDDGEGNQNNNNNTTDPVCGNGIPEAGEECDDGDGNSDVAPNACRTNCRDPFCGDEVPDTGEACDDGNLVSGDGCAEDCSSDETCGNHTLDEHVGEQCDDGNTTPGDGCSAACRIEECGNGLPDPGEGCDDGGYRSHDGCSSACDDEIDAWWVQPAAPSALTDRQEASMAYDRARDVLVLFGGNTAAINPDLVDDTWEHDGVGWTQRTLATKPSPRRDAHMAYDELRCVVVLFGGDVGNLQSAFSDETWEYDGTAWVNVTASLGGSPPATARGAMVYDANRQVMVLFGGARGTPGNLTVTNETWEYDGSQWTPVVTLASPIARADHAMAYDRSRHVTVLFGGRNGVAASSDLPDTWEYNSTSWTNPSTTSPGARRKHLLAYDEWQWRVVLFSGFCSTLAGCTYTDTHSWSGSVWTNLQPDISPTTRWATAWSYSPLEKGVVFFGGCSRDTGGTCVPGNDLWILRYDTNPPSPREQCASGADEDGDDLVDCEDPDCEGLPCATGRCVSGICQ